MEFIKLVVLHRRTCSGIMCGASTCTSSFECFQQTLMGGWRLLVTHTPGRCGAMACTLSISSRGLHLPVSFLVFYSYPC